MSVFNPELKEYRESNFETNKFSPEHEKKLLKALDDGKEKFPDIIQCPIQSCGNPLKIEIREDSIFLKCTSCGWEQILKKRNDPIRLHIEYSLTFEVDRVKKTLSKLDWYHQQGYYPSLPEGLSQTSGDEEILEAVKSQYLEDAYRRCENKLRDDFENVAETFVIRLEELFGAKPSPEINIRLTQYGTSGSYQLPNFVVFDLNSKDGVKVLFHEIVHLMIEPMVVKHGILHWEKERIVDLILHSPQFAFLDYQDWQRDYHGVEHYIDPLFHSTFFSDQTAFFQTISKKRIDLGG